jgi:tetratricopeptide (TPR) repeat protein
MSRKTNSSKKPKRWKSLLTQSPGQIDAWLRSAGDLMIQRDYAGAVEIYERLLNYLPQRSPQRVDVLANLGAAQAMQQNFPQSYEALTEALSIQPNSADLWYNRGLACRFTGRAGQSMRDYERAVELNKDGKMTRQFNEELKFSRKLAEKSMKLRGPDFTLDQLIEQENYFQHGLKCMENTQWEEAEEAFRRSIAMGDCLPQPWGNLGGCLILQGRYDEAEAALKRALEIDPRYTIAKKNLADLPEMRRIGGPQLFGIRDPYKEMKLKKSITFLREE